MTPLSLESQRIFGQLLENRRESGVGLVESAQSLRGLPEAMKVLQSTHDGLIAEQTVFSCMQNPSEQERPGGSVTPPNWKVLNHDGRR